MAKSERNGTDFYSLARRRTKSLRNRRRDRTFTNADVREATQELGDQAYAILSARYQMTN
jgi:hypothetical protein